MADKEDCATAATTSPMVPQADLLKQRNRILALSLASVAALALIVAVTLAVLVHDGGLKHVLAGL